ncbi:hypothetical protein SAMN05421823_101434 [Catalinimonas alkaloidigena]|uniref:SpoIIAA-like n=1 Tax=Catalinimonas alkaloidigena TaxID=1075417 RepID=A0A1G8XQE1_9BACT|nr:hypothetical protein [Catalinimonas alkaloidigena]SDJ92404.1 hypothetical protein SAMN05421823_101434 [Catalinimonas alkaloidigena]
MIAVNKAIYADPFAEITYDDANKVLVAKWMGFLKIDSTQKGCISMVDFVKRNKVTKHLSDQSTLKVLSKDVQTYLVTEAFPALDRAGLRKLAVLVSEDIFAKASVENVNTNATKMGNISIRTFGTRKECIAWLNE